VFRAHTFRANHGARLRGANRILALALLTAAAACHAQSQENDAYRGIPDWVKIDRAVLVEAAAPSLSAGPEEQQSPHYTFSTRETAPWPEKESWLRQRYVRMVAADAYKIAANSAPGSYPHETEAPRNDVYRPAVSQSQTNAWRVTVPNLRKNVAKVMLHRSF
jgi:hypothetical protein